MPWNKIELGVTLWGDLLIGSADVQHARVLGELHDSVRVFPSQMQYRCVANDRFSPLAVTPWKIMTHRAAAAAGFYIGESFPVADGRYSIRRRR